MKKMAIGIMSGTSLDGIDVVLCEISGSYLDTKVTEVAFKTYHFEEALKLKTLKAINLESTSAKDICSLNFELGHLFADCVMDFLKFQGLSNNQIDFIASHGQTVYHIPFNEVGFMKSTLQLGDGSLIANLTNITTISNFRVADMALGGQGAPLVPYAEYILYSNNQINRSMHNLGGISNLTVLPKTKIEKDVFAFDTGPANMMIDHAMNELFKKPYDNSGLVARSGTLIKPMIDELLQHDYFKLLPPKSTGRELFGDAYTKYMINKYREYKSKDIIHTLTYFTAKTIIDAYQKFVLPRIRIDEIIFAGGGAYNKFLLELIKNGLKDIKIRTLEDLGHNSHSKEAVAFVILGNETLNGHYNHLVSATGANKQCILGQISPVFRRLNHEV